MDGYFPIREYSSSTIGGWISGQYQDDLDKAVHDHVSFRSDLIRLYNQLDFSLFQLAHAEKIIVGEKGYLLANQYLDAWLGMDYKGYPYIKKQAKKFALLQDLLWEREKKLLILVFPPDKATFYAEYIPERYLRKKRNSTNYHTYLKELVAEGADFIDFNSYFLTLKGESDYILYPKTGIHWSNYGAIVAAGSLTKYIESKMGIFLPRIVIDTILVSDILEAPDGDIEKTLNLIWQIPHPDMAYPVVHFDSNSHTTKVNALIVGDSFYWNWYYSEYIKNTFTNDAFWYYNKEVYPEHFTTPTTVWDIDRQRVIGNADILIILLVNAGYGDIGYGFLDEIATYLGIEDPRITGILNQMKNNPEWMQALENKAREREITLEQMMIIDARYMINEGV